MFFPPLSSSVWLIAMDGGTDAGGRSPELPSSVTRQAGRQQVGKWRLHTCGDRRGIQPTNNRSRSLVAGPCRPRPEWAVSREARFAGEIQTSFLLQNEFTQLVRFPLSALQVIARPRVAGRGRPSSVSRSGRRRPGAQMSLSLVSISLHGALRPRSNSAPFGIGCEVTDW